MKKKQAAIIFIIYFLIIVTTASAVLFRAEATPFIYRTPQKLMILKSFTAKKGLLAIHR